MISVTVKIDFFDEELMNARTPTLDIRNKAVAVMMKGLNEGGNCAFFIERIEYSGKDLNEF